MSLLARGGGFETNSGTLNTEHYAYILTLRWEFIEGIENICLPDKMRHLYQ